MLCLVFVGWWFLGTDRLDDAWVTATKWWGLLVYLLIHVTLAGMILRTAGLRMWLTVLCVLGLVLVEFVARWDAVMMFFFFTGWKFGGFV